MRRAAMTVAALIALAGLVRLALPPRLGPVAPSAPETWFRQMYEVPPGEVMRFVPPWYPVGRYKTYAAKFYGPSPRSAIDERVDYWVDESSKRPWIHVLGGSTVKGAIESTARLSYVQLDVPEDLADVPVLGDWALRLHAPLDARLAATQDLLRQALGRPITIEPRRASRRVIAVSGTYHFVSLGRGSMPNRVQMFTDAMDTGSPRYGGGSGSLADFVERIEDCTRLPVVVDPATRAPARLSWAEHRSTLVDDHTPGRTLAALLDNLARQTSLSFNVTTRGVIMYFVREEAAPAAATRP